MRVGHAKVRRADSELQFGHCLGVAPVFQFYRENTCDMALWIDEKRNIKDIDIIIPLVSTASEL